MAVLSALAASGALAQAATDSLPDAAEREKERRKATPKAKVYTETSLPKATATGFERVEESSPSATASPAPGKAEKTVDEVRAEKKAGYEKRIAEQVRTIEVVRKAMDEAQLELNDVNTITKYGSRKDALLKILDDGQAEIKKADQAIADIEEEARREGISVSRP